MNEALQAVIDRAWDDRDAISPDTRGKVRGAGPISPMCRLDGRIGEARKPFRRHMRFEVD